MRFLTLIMTVLCLRVFVHADAVPTSAPAAPMVMVIPFQQIGDTNSYGWVAQAVQEDLLGQVAREGTLQPKAFDKPVAGTDSATAIQVGHDAGATMVVFGSYQIVSDHLRVNAQAADVPTGKIIGSLQATGEIHDLFKLEDSLSAQLAQLLPQVPGGSMPIVTYGTPNDGMYPSTPSMPSQPVPDTSSSDTYTAPDYGPNYAYPDYSYPYYYYPPYFYGGFFFVDRFHHHDFFHGGDHGFHGHPQNHGFNPGGMGSGGMGRSMNGH